MNKQLIIYMPLMILCMLKLKELKKVSVEMMVFFVLQQQEIVLPTYKYVKLLKYRFLSNCLTPFQFSVFCYGFSVLVSASGKFNSLYRASDSLKIRK